MPSQPSSLELLTMSATLMLKNNTDLIELANEGFLGKDGTGELQVFSGTDNNKPFMNIEGTGTCNMVVSAWAGDGPGSRYSSAQFMTLQILVFADESRGVDNSVTSHDAQTKALRIYSVFDKIFNDNKNVSKVWWGLEILESTRSGMGIYPVENEDGLYVLQATYSVSLY